MRAETRRVRRAKIVATLGPSTDGIEADLVAAGLDVARLNLSHGGHDEHRRRCQAIRDAAEVAGRSVAVMMDLQGPKIRVGHLAGGGPVMLVAGQRIAITTREVAGNAELISCTYEGLPSDVRPGDRLLLDDGRIRLVATAIESDTVVARVEEGGPLGEHKGINLPGVAVSAPALTDKDWRDLRFGLLDLNVDYVALSFVRRPDDVREARTLAHSLGHNTPIVVKLEKGEAIEQLEAILDEADGVMVARGDLGVELAPERVPMLQKTIVQRANQRGIPVITATQMLESMVTEETPTRAEASDVANAVWDGTDAVMLSAETAAGRHPLLALRMMDRIVRAAEAAEVPRRLPSGASVDERPVTDRAAQAIVHAASVLAADLSAAAIAVVTHSGRTAQMLSQGRANVPIYAFSPDGTVRNRLALWWGVTPVHQPLGQGLEVASTAMAEALRSHGVAADGDVVVITGVHPFRPGSPTNFVKYLVLGQE